MVFVGLTYPARGYRASRCFIADPVTQGILWLSDVVLKTMQLAADGNHTYNDIVKSIAEQYKLLYGEAEVIALESLFELRKNGLVTFSQESLSKQSFIFSDSINVGRALLSLTHRCNFNCIHCLQGEKKDFCEEMSTKEWIDIIGQLSDYGVSVIFFTGGEPLLRKDVVDILQAAGEYAFPMRLYTNGLLINDNLVDSLRSFNTLTLQISFHGISPATFDSFVGVKGAFDRVVQSIKSLTDAGVRVAVATCFRDELIPHMEEVPALLEKLGVVEWVPSLIMPMGCAYENWAKLRLASQNMRIFIDTLLRLMSIYKGGNLQVSAPFDISLLQGNTTTWENSEISFGCDLYGQYINVEPDGSVTPCDRNTYHKLGSLRQESLKQIMSKHQVIQAHKDDIQRMLKEIGALDRCDKCKYQDLCGRGCPGILLQGKNLGEEYDDPIVCRMFNEGFDLLLKYSTPFAREQLLETLRKV